MGRPIRREKIIDMLWHDLYLLFPSTTPYPVIVNKFFIFKENIGNRVVSVKFKTDIPIGCQVYPSLHSDGINRRWTHGQN